MIRDTALIVRSELRLVSRSLTGLALDLAQPIAWLLLFTPLMAGALKNSPSLPVEDAWMVLTPSITIYLVLMSSAFSGYRLLNDLRSGVLERMRVTPASRTALLLGKVVVYVLQTAVQSLLVFVVAWLLFDLRITVVGIVLALAVGALITLMLTACSITLALLARREPTFTAVISSCLLPLSLLSGILVPITRDLAPEWLYILSRFNPLTWVADLSRAAFNVHYAFQPVVIGGAVLLAMTGLSLWWGTRTFNREIP
ncbi:ABC-2 type transport system permease protein [Streptosporangium album]|uniref:Transport permease protein n=1 Tax=Streptosporangium album TaxID=47479 RepID=A0A7W7S5G9_9ACTN|nr:ABC transporter permease [Streptosporangium album]MBB4944239.1 ABC-2 type transport system permease protein [Streptosporangium album]